MVFYFSGTGNSRYAALQLADRLDTRALDMAAELSAGDLLYTVAPQEPVVFVFPVHFFGLPALVWRFLRRMVLESEAPISVHLVLTCGGATGDAAGWFGFLCEAKGLTLCSTAAVRMPDNYIPLFDVPTGREIDALLDEADEALAEEAEHIRAGEPGSRDALRGRLPRLTSFFAQIAYWLFMRRTRPFHVQGDRCVHCGICAENCPEGAIRMGEDGLPVWEKKRCTMCMQCLNRCPARCIQYGKKTEQRGRYFNPRVLRR